MNLIRLAVAVGLAWVVAKLLLKSRGGEPIDVDNGLTPLRSVDLGLPVRVRAMTVPGAAAAYARSAGFARGA